MAGEAVVTVRGFLGKDAAKTVTPGGTELVELSVAAGVRRKNAAGEWEDVRTDWYRCAAFGRLIPLVENLAKGTLVEVTGYLRPGAYLAKQDPANPAPAEAHVSLDVTLEKLLVVPRKPAEVQEPAPAGAPF